MHTKSTSHHRLSPTARIALAYLIAVTWISTFAVATALAVANWR